MLSATRKTTTITASSVIDGKDAEGYSAVINSDNPEDMTISSWQTDKALYKKNRVQCRKDQAEFEDLAYTLQDQMISEQETQE